MESVAGSQLSLSRRISEVEKTRQGVRGGSIASFHHRHTSSSFGMGPAGEKQDRLFVLRLIRSSQPSETKKFLLSMLEENLSYQRVTLHLKWTLLLPWIWKHLTLECPTFPRRLLLFPRKVWSCPLLSPKQRLWCPRNQKSCTEPGLTNKRSSRSNLSKRYAGDMACCLNLLESCFVAYSDGNG
jgi:hypothetical protein